MTDPTFNVQQALTDLARSIKSDLQDSESRVREDIRVVSATAVMNAAHAQEVADAALLASTGIEGRVVSLEGDAKWIKGGFGTTFLAAIAFAWHVVAGRP